MPGGTPPERKLQLAVGSFHNELEVDWLASESRVGQFVNLPG